MKCLCLWQNIKECRGEGKECHQYFTHYQTFHPCQHPEHQKFCISINFFAGVHNEQQVYSRTDVLITDSPVAANDKEMDNLIDENRNIL